jgi:Dihaem cytochrome c
MIVQRADDHILLALAFTGFALSCLIAGCQKPKPLPEQGSYSQQLYVERCGACHRPYNPGSMTAAMWDIQVEAMRAKMAQAGLPPLSPEQHHAILQYLERNAGSQ